MSSRSQQIQVDAFKLEFEKVLQDQLDQGSQIYLIDVIEDLRFIDTNLMSSLFDIIDQLLVKQGLSLILETANQHPQFLQDIQGNLFRLCLAIVGLRPSRAPDMRHVIPDEEVSELLVGLNQNNHRVE